MPKFLGLVGLLALVVGASACSKDPQVELRRHLDQADQYAKKKAYAEAIIEYRIAVSQDANSGIARLGLAKAYEASGDLPNAFREFVRAADLLPDDADAQLNAGRMLISAKQFPEARQRAEAVLSKNPRNAEALALLGNALAGLKDLDAAITQLEEAVDAEPHRVLSYANLGALRAFKGDSAAAEKAFRKATEIEPDSVAAHLSLANYLWASEQTSEAIQEFNSALRLDPKSGKALQGLATLYVSLGDRADAVTYMEKLAQAFPDSGPMLLLADYYVIGNQTAQAKEVLKKLTQSQKPGTEAYNSAVVRLAALDHSEGRKDDAYSSLNAVLKTNNLDTGAMLVKARLLLRDHRAQEALQTITPLVDAKPELLGAQFVKGQALQATGKRDEAIQTYQEALKLGPTSVPTMLRLANLLTAAGNYTASSDMASQAIKVAPQSAEAHYELAKALALQGNYHAAQTEMTPLLKAAPSASQIHFLQGQISWALGDVQKARDAYAKAAELDPESVAALAGQIEVDLFLKNESAAREKIKKALASMSKSSALLDVAGRTYFVMGDTKPAEAALLEAVNLDPSNRDAFAHLTSLYGTQGRLDEALRLFETTKLPPIVSLTLQGIVLSLQGKSGSAQQKYEQAIAIDPGAPVAANNLAFLYAEQGQNLEVAQQLAQTAKAKLPEDPEVSDTLGWVYYRKGLADLAVTAFKEGLTRDKNNPVLHYHLGLAYAKNGDKPEARRALEQALKLNPTFPGSDDAKRVLTSLKG